MRRVFLVFLVLFSVKSGLVFSQVSINDNGAAPNSNAILDVDVSSNDKGILIPRLTTSERENMSLSSSDKGLTVFDETTDNYWYWDGSKWVKMITGGEAWLLTGNSGINSTDFLGTTDNNPLIFKTNGSEIMRITEDGKIGIGTASPSTDITAEGKKLWIIAPGGSVSDINPTVDAVAISTGNYYSFNVYNNGTNTGAAYFRTNTSTNTKPTLEVDQYGNGQGILITTYGTGTPLRAQTNSADTTAYFTNSKNGDNISVVHAIYDGSGTNGNVAVYGEAHQAGDGNGTGVKGWGGWTGIYGKGGTYAGYFYGNVKVVGNLTVTGSISKGSGTFAIDYPLDPENKILYHSFVESPDMLNIYSGTVKTNDDSIAKVVLPEYFTAVNKDYSYYLTVIGQFAQAIVYKEVDKNGVFYIKTSKPNVKVSWMVTGIRNDPYAQKYRIKPVVDKKPENRGKFLHPELYGYSEEYGIDYYDDTNEHSALKKVNFVKGK